MPTRRVRPGVAVALVLLVGLGLSSCGDGDGGSDAASVPLDTWVEEVNALCADALAEIDQVDQPAGSDDFAVIEESGNRVLDITDAFIADVEALGNPDERAATAQSFVTSFRAYRDGVEEVVTAAGSGDEDAVNDAADAVDPLVEERDELAGELGVTDCVADDGADGSDPAGGDGGDALPPEEWAAEIDAACTRLGQQYAGIGETVPADEAELQQLAQDLEAFVTEIVAEFDRVGPPAGDTTRAQALYDQFVELQAAAVALREATAAQDTTGAQAAAAELEAIGSEINPLATELGVEACGGF